MENRLWIVLTPGGPNAQEGAQLRSTLRDAGLSIAPAFSSDVNAAVLIPGCGKGYWAMAGVILGRGGRVVVVKRDSRTRALIDLGAVSCENVDEFVTRIREGML